MFSVSYAPTDLPISIAFHAAPPSTSGWTFNLAGSQTANLAEPFAGKWLSSLAWDGDKLVLTMAGTVHQDGKTVPVVTKLVLSFVTAEGAAKGDLEVVATSTPSGVLPDGVCTYKKIG
jgi:hypothetical protein